MSAFQWVRELNESLVEQGTLQLTVRVETYEEAEEDES